MFTVVGIAPSWRFSPPPGVYLTATGRGAISGDVMPPDVECTHCHVLMTSWSAPRSTVRYWQCPFCSRTHSSLYSEVFERGAGARRVEPVQPAAAVPAVPQARPEDIRWGQLKARAAQWFARLEEEQVAVPRRPRPVAPPRPPQTAVVAPAQRRSR
jgi:hypothetical protein